MRIVVFLATILVLVSGCSPEVGSEKWCTNMKGKQSDEWTIKETKEYAKHCIFK